MMTLIRGDRPAEHLFGITLDQARTRLEGRLEVIEAARARYVRLLRELKRLRWKRRVRRQVELFREAAWKEPDVVGALAALQARAMNEGWPHNCAALELGRACGKDREALESLLERRQRAWELSGLSLTGRLAALVTRLGPRRLRKLPPQVPLGILERQGDVTLLSRAEHSPAVLLGLFSPIAAHLPYLPRWAADGLMDAYARCSGVLGWMFRQFSLPTLRAEIRYHRGWRLLGMSIGTDAPWAHQTFKLVEGSKVLLVESISAEGERLRSVAVGPVELEGTPARTLNEVLLGSFGALRHESAAEAAAQLASELGIPVEERGALPAPAHASPALLSGEAAAQAD